MNLKEVCQHEVATIRKEQNILEAAKKMRDEHTGSLVVIQPENKYSIPCGIVTDRDILIQLIAQKLPAEKFMVEDIMSNNPICAREEDDVFETIQQMRRKGIRRMPVIDEHQSLIGMIAMDDLLSVIAKELKNLSGIMSQERRQESQNRP